MGKRGETMTEEEKERVIELGKQFGFEASFNYDESGIYVENEKVADLLDMFPEIKPCCEYMLRNINGGCDNCGDPCF